MSFVSITKDSDFSYENLPYGVFSKIGQDSTKQVGVAIGQLVLNLHVASVEFADFFPSTTLAALQHENLDKIVSLGEDERHAVRAAVKKLLAVDSPLAKNAELQLKLLEPQSECKMHMPVKIANYTDFYSSIEHARNVGSMFRDPLNPLLPNWKWLPVGYHGRASSVVISGTDIRRPKGQVSPVEGEQKPQFVACRAMDFELEIAFITGGAVASLNDLGETISVKDAQKFIFGVVLMNDWSARDIQKWEYVPLGPFTAKNFATTISPWIVPLEALMPFAVANPVQEPSPHEYLHHSDDFTFNMTLEVAIRPSNVTESTIVCRSNMKNLYWTMKQQLAHHAITGCNIQSGDLYGSGTISGPEPASYGSMLELTLNGKKPLTLHDGTSRGYLKDGDEVIMRGYTEVAGKSRVGFGECRGLILPSKQ